MREVKTLSVLVENKTGVLARVAGLFARRGYNIESLAVGPTDKPELSRITISVLVDQLVLEQIVKQLNKLIEVIKVTELDEEHIVGRELILVKVHATHSTRGEIIDIVQLFRGKTVDVQIDTVTIEATGSPDKLEALVEMLRPYGIRELVQSGLVALGRGNTNQNHKSGLTKNN
ncbi:MAG: acetolactate synthase small subunit [Propionibacteriaceae bacterium]|jgi:acetolactate synthase-1/3 small subunit|nr:acetolactate synthase small subunit [Propionibacteriaceae bacterium]